MSAIATPPVAALPKVAAPIAPPKPEAGPIAPAMLPAAAPKVTGPLFDALNNANVALTDSLRTLQSIAPERADDPAVTPVRKTAYDQNKAAQQGIEWSFNQSTTPPQLISVLRQADSSLEYATFKMVGKDPISKEKVGIDLRGAIIDTQHAAALVQDLLGTPGQQPTPPTPPIPGQPPVAPQNPRVVAAVTTAQAALGQSLTHLKVVPFDGADDPQYTPVRKAAYDANKQAQGAIEPLFGDTSLAQDVIARLRSADSALETATFNMVGKDPVSKQKVPIDIRGAIAQSEQAGATLAGLLSGAPQPAPGGETPPVAAGGGVAPA